MATRDLDGMSSIDTERQCTRPDRDCPKIVCGYPMPCPHHTIKVPSIDSALEVGERVRHGGKPFAS